MESPIILKILHQVDSKAAPAKRNGCWSSLKRWAKSSRFTNASPQASSDQLASGFTLIETLLVIMLVGILSASAAPSWIAFTNRQRVNAANEAVLRALQDARREAEKSKRSYSITFKTENKVPKVAIHRADNTNPTNWENLGKDLEIKPGQVLLNTNLTGENTVVTQPTQPTPPTPPPRITFAYTGGLSIPANLGTKGLIVTVAIPQPGNPTQALDATERCVRVMTLLGAMQTGRKDECNAQ